MAKTREAGGAPEMKVDTVEAGGVAVTAAGTSDAAVALAEAEAVGGAPAAGQGHAAEVVEGAAVRDTKVPDGGDALRRYRPGVIGADYPEDDDGNAIVTRVADPARQGHVDPLGLHPADRIATFGRAPAADVAAVRRSGRDAIMPLSMPTIDVRAVPGRKAAKAVTQLRHDNFTYLPGEIVPIDFRAHSELVPIGAIEATPWDDLPDHTD